MNLPQLHHSEQLDLIKRTIAKGATNDELMLFIYQCNRTGLDPLSRQVYAIKRWDSREKRETMAIQISIDGMRLLAERTGKYEGQSAPQWFGPESEDICNMLINEYKAALQDNDTTGVSVWAQKIQEARQGKWHDIWVSPDPPLAAKVGVFKTGFRQEVVGIAHFEEYAQRTKDGDLTSFWKKMPANQLAKCAESLALRKAFPAEMSGLYSVEELPPPVEYHSPSSTVVPPQAQIPPPAEAPTPLTDETTKNFKFLQTMESHKKNLGDESYYALLGSYGYLHANEILDRVTQVTVHRAMTQQAQEQAFEHEEGDDHEESA